MSNIFNMRVLKSIIMIVLMLGIGALEPISSITPYGMKVIGVFIGMLFGWVFIDVGSCSLIGLTVLVLSGCISMDEALVGVFGNQTAVLFLMVFLFSAYIEEENIGEIVAYWILKRNFLKGRPYLLFMFFLIASYIVGILSGSIVGMFLMVALLRAMNEIAQFPPYSKQLTIFMLGICLTSVLGELGLPTKGVPMVYMNLYSANAGGAMFNMVKYIISVIPLSIYIIVCYTFFCKFILRIDMKKLANAQEALTGSKHASKQQKIALVVTAIYMAALLTPSIPINNPIYQKFSSLGMGGISLFVFGIFMLIHIDGKPIINVTKIAKGFPWSFFFMVATIMYLAGILTSEATGIQTALSSLFYPMLSGMSGWAVMCLLFAITAILTNFINNVVAGSIMISLGCAFSAALPDINLQALTIMLAIAGMFSVFTPAAGVNTAWFFAQTDLIRPRDLMIYGFVSVIFLIITTALVAPFYLDLIF